MPTSAISLVSRFGALAFTLGGFTVACRGNLPPTEPRRVAHESMPAASTTEDGPALGPLAGLAPEAVASGGKRAMPISPKAPGGVR